MAPAIERIDFHNPSVGKPVNLQNSAVLRMLEEEERRGGRVGDDGYYPKPLRDVPWPPLEYDQKTLLRSSFKDVVTPGAKRVAWPPPQEGVLDPADVVQQTPVPTQGGPQYSTRSPQNNYSPQQGPYQAQPPAPQQSHRPLRPLDVNLAGTGSPLGSPALNQSPQAFKSGTPGAGPKGWASVQSPVSTPLGPAAQKYFGSAPAQVYQPGQPQYQPVSQPHQGYSNESQQLSSYQQQSSGYQQHPTGYQQQQLSGYQQQPSGFDQQQYQQSYQQRSSGYQQQQTIGYQQQPYTQSSHQQFTQSSGYSAQVQPQPQSASYQSAPQQYQSQSVQSQNQFAPQPAVAQTQAVAPRQQPAKQVEPPPSTITLRAAAPVSQAPAPVYSAQPATASLKGGKHLRGDLKWPPENVRQKMAEEHQQLLELAKGPACRPLKKEKDYTPFFEQHALAHAYPGYKIPPGTQFYRPEY
ncbi:hypothetical protein ABEB36_003681 [Hypothenemus hampei]|uniref:Uncharacterized protein n=1 Tax=Hypothenemus hampei TaxID=57062 RepID=A0ABD1F1D2_HYPHA